MGNQDSTIAIYPRIDDMTIIIDLLVETFDRGSVGILYNFGKKLGIKYYGKMGNINILDDNEKFSNILNVMVVSNWFTDVKAQQVSDVGHIVTTTNAIEVFTTESSCNFMRGFIVGLAECIYNTSFSCTEQHNNEAVCTFTLKKE